MDRKKEKRKHKRIKKYFIVELKVKPHSKEKAVSRGWETVTAENLGANGTLFYYHRKLEPGTLIDLKIYFVRFKTAINCLGKVVRVEESPSGAIFRTAVKFTKINKKHSDMINTVAENPEEEETEDDE